MSNNPETGDDLYNFIIHQSQNARSSWEDESPPADDEKSKASKLAFSIGNGSAVLYRIPILKVRKSVEYLINLYNDYAILRFHESNYVDFRTLKMDGTEKLGGGDVPWMLINFSRVLRGLYNGRQINSSIEVKNSGLFKLNFSLGMDPETTNFSFGDNFTCGVCKLATEDDTKRIDEYLGQLDRLRRHEGN